jgi:hypothetical protein
MPSLEVVAVVADGPEVETETGCDDAGSALEMDVEEKPLAAVAEGVDALKECWLMAHASNFRSEL